MTHLIRLSLRYRGLVILIALAVMAYGSYLASRWPIDVFPDLDRPRVVLLTEAPGLSTDDVESLVAMPLEQSLLGAPGVEAVRSQASAGMLVTHVEFGWREEIRTARQTVQERLTTAQALLPPGIKPLLTPPASIMGQIMHVGLMRRPGPKGGALTPIGETGLMLETRDADRPVFHVWTIADRRDMATWTAAMADVAYEADSRIATVSIAGRSHRVPVRDAVERSMDLRSIADFTVRPRLLSRSGVAEVIVMGGETKQYQVHVDPSKLQEFQVSLSDVDRAIRENNLNVGGGFTEEGPVERSIRIVGRLGPEAGRVIDDLRQIPVRSEGDRPVLLRQVAMVREGPAVARGDAGVDGFPAICLTIAKQPHADTRGLTDDIKKSLGDIEASLPPDYTFQTDLFQLKGFIDRAIYYVGEALAIGAALVVIVLFLFLLNLRTTFITLTAIPLSLAVTMLVFKLIGWLTGTELSINVMTLGGIAVAMGELVDDAIVDVENIARRLSENASLPAPQPKLTVIFEASREIRSSIVFGTAVVVLAFLPLFALSGVEGRLFVPLGLAYVTSILASLVVSLTVTPALSSVLLSAKARHGSHGSPLLRLLQWLAGFLVRFSMRYALALLVLTWVVVGWAAWRLTTLGSDFLPKFDEGSVQFDVALPSGSSLSASKQAAAIMDAKLRLRQVSPGNPDGDILHFVRRTGRAERDEHAEPVGRSEYILSMNPTKVGQRAAFLQSITEELERELPGATVEAEQPLDHLISHMLSGVKSNIAIKIVGDDLARLRTLANQVKGAIEGLPGMSEPVIEPQELIDELHIVLRADDLAYYGLSRQSVATLVETALKGESVTQVVDGPRRFDVVVRLSGEARTDYRQLAELRIDLPGRGRPGSTDAPRQIRLKDVADIDQAAVGPNQVNRENARRRAVIRCNARGRDLASLVADLDRRIQARVPMPEGYHVEFGGQFQAQRSATMLIAVLAGVSLVGMFATLYLLVPSVRIVLQILNAVPTAFVGGVVALVITNQSVTVASLVGFVSLGGIAVRNGILLVTHYLHLMKEEGESFSDAMVLRGSLERLSPVLMTALTAGIALVPLVIGGQKPGLEILYPVSTVILGGLVSSTFCEFLLHPGLFRRFTGRDAEAWIRPVESGIG
jgi:HME family heavy-metal exporter